VKAGPDASLAKYRLFVPAQAVGASLVYFDLFNAGLQGRQLSLLSVTPVVSGAVAVTGVVGVDLFLTRTTAIGTGGTAATSEGSSLTAATFSALDNDSPLPANGYGITARLTPSGGATAGAVLTMASVFTEETSPGAYSPAPDMVRGWHEDPAFIIKAGTGIRVVQGGVASVGNIAFNVLFDVREG